MALLWICQLGRNQPDILGQLILSIIDFDLEHERFFNKIKLSACRNPI
jgi:hypothetical protein